MASTYAPALRRKLREAGLQGSLDAGAFKRLLKYVDEVDGSLDELYALIDALKTDIEFDGALTQAQVDEAIGRLRGDSARRDLIFVVSAFDVPRVVYDPVTKRLRQDKTPTSLVPPAEAKQRLYLNRLNLLYQRLRRNERFQPPNPVAGGNGNGRLQVQLTELAGLKGAAGSVRVVMGLISSGEDGRLRLEDAGGGADLDLSAARVTSGFITENCVVVAEGEIGADGALRVLALGFPACEPRGSLPTSAQRLDFFGAPRLSDGEAALTALAEAERADDRVVLLAGVALDRPATFDALHELFLGFEQAGAVPPVFVLMGNFLSGAAATDAAEGAGGGSGAGFGGGLAGGGGGDGARQAADFLALRDGFSNLAALLGRYPSVRDGARFVFVPGPNDPGLGDVLPSPPLPSYFTADLAAALPNAVFATNPCRIKYFSREIVVFRHDLARSMLRRCLVPPADLSPDDADMCFAHLALTVLQQSHLCPLPLVVQPVHWAHDAALQLYPLPHALVLAGGGAQAQFAHEGCTVMDPGNFTEQGMFAAFLPFRDELEPCELPSRMEG